jgi:predicted GTPase
MRRLLVLGAGGRDFHDFQTTLRDDPTVEVVGFTAAQIPGIDDRVFPASLAGPRYPRGIPIHPQRGLARLVADLAVDEVVLSYSDLPHTEVMHLASEALAAGAGFRLLPPARTMLAAEVPVVAVCAVRTGAGKSQTSRKVGRLLLDAGLRVALVRHPMPYGDLEAMRVQRFATQADIDASRPTVEEREEYEVPVAMGMVMWAGVDYAEILRRASTEADVLVWDGGNNDTPFFRPDLHVTVADPLRAGHEVLSHPGELNFRMADVVVVNKMDAATPEQVGQVLANLAALNPRAVVVRAASPVTLQDGPPVAGRRVLVVEDGPTLTHGGMAFGAGTVAARAAGAAELVDPRPYAVGSVAEVFRRYPHLGPVLPAMGYSDQQLGELGETIRAVPCDVVVTGTPTDLTRLVDLGHPSRHATYELEEIGSPRLGDVLSPVIAAARRRAAAPAPA